MKDTDGKFKMIGAVAYGWRQERFSFGKGGERGTGHGNLLLAFAFRLLHACLTGFIVQCLYDDRVGGLRRCRIRVMEPIVVVIDTSWHKSMEEYIEEYQVVFCCWKSVKLLESESQNLFDPCVHKHPCIGTVRSCDPGSGSSVYEMSVPRSEKGKSR